MQWGREGGWRKSAKDIDMVLVLGQALKVGAIFKMFYYWIHITRACGEYWPPRLTGHASVWS